jgi:hypothetical protein
MGWPAHGRITLVGTFGVSGGLNWFRMCHSRLLSKGAFSFSPSNLLIRLSTHLREERWAILGIIILFFIVSVVMWMDMMVSVTCLVRKGTKAMA